MKKSRPNRYIILDFLIISAFIIEYYITDNPAIPYKKLISFLLLYLVMFCSLYRITTMKSDKKEKKISISDYVYRWVLILETLINALRLEKMQINLKDDDFRAYLKYGEALNLKMISNIDQ